MQQDKNRVSFVTFGTVFLLKKTFLNFFKWGVTSVTSVTRTSQHKAEQGFFLGTLLSIFGTLVTVWGHYRTTSQNPRKCLDF